MSGVEENAISRFIDYTFATPFEELSHKIFDAAKKWLTHDQSQTASKIRLLYQDSDYFLSFVNDGLKVRESSESFASLRKSFGVSKFLLLSPGSRWTDLTPSTKQALLSAISIASSSLWSVGMSIPFFIASTELEKLDSDQCIFLGIEIRAASELSTLVTTFESHLHQEVSSRHELYCLDGVLKNFESRLMNFAGLDCASVRESIKCDVIEEFRYLHDGSVLSQRTQPPLFTRNPRSKDSSFRHAMCSLWCALPDYNPRVALTSDLKIELRYAQIRPGCFVDNDRLTTLQPSKQLPRAWRLETSFKPTYEIASKVSNHPDGDSAAASNMLSTCIRRLLAFQLASQMNTSTDVTLSSIGGDTSVLPPDLLSRVTSIASDLSPLTQTIVESMLSSRRIREDLQEHPGLVDEQDEHPFKQSFPAGLKAILFSHLQAEAETQLGSWMDLFSVFVGCSAFDVGHVAEMWIDCLEELRLHWEVESTIPRSWGSPAVATESIHWETTRDRNVKTTNRHENVKETTHDVELDASGVGSDSAVGGEASSVSQTKCETESFLWERQLWANKIARLIDSGLFVCRPDLRQFLVTQKLQLLNMCIACKKERIFCCIPKEYGPFRVSRSVSAVGTGATGATVVQPSLQRRQPVTADGLIHYKQMCAKFSSSAGGEVGDNQLVKWQVIAPAVIADVRAFKAANSSICLDDFLKWYIGQGLESLPLLTLSSAPSLRLHIERDGRGIQRGQSEEVDPSRGAEMAKTFGKTAAGPHEVTDPLGLSQHKEEQTADVTKKTVLGDFVNDENFWTDIWKVSTACPAESQKPLFRPEMEAEKTLASLASLHPTMLGAQMLASGLVCVYAMMENELVSIWGERVLENSSHKKGGRERTTSGGSFGVKRSYSVESLGGSIESYDFLGDGDGIDEPFEFDCDEEEDDDHDLCEYIAGKMELLRAMIEEVVKQLAADEKEKMHIRSMPSHPTNASPSVVGSGAGTGSATMLRDSVSGEMKVPLSGGGFEVIAAADVLEACAKELALRVDAIAGLIERLEELVLRAHEIATVLMMPLSGPGSRLVTTLARCGTASPLNADEAQAVFELVKFVSRELESHTWSSVDGRELGLPRTKTFHIRCSGDLNEREGGETTFRPGHQLWAQVQGDKMTLSLRFQEVD